MDASAHFRGKKITLMGLGLLGRGLGDALYLAECGADLVITDLKSEEELATSFKELAKFPHIRYTLGTHKLEDFRGRDLVLFGPKIPLDSTHLAEARRNGTHTTMSTALFAKLAGIPVVGVTGTRGKSTTTEMIAHVLRTAGKKVLVGGNIRGVSTLSLLPDVTSDSIAVLELDSWQLQGFRAEQISPNVAVFTNLYPDHQDYYADMNAYLADKVEIFLHQKSGDTLVLGSEIEESVQETYGSRINASVVVPTTENVPNLLVPGEHNIKNAALAAAAARALSVPEDDIRRALETFTGVPGRLECVREKDGVKFYNDTTATTPEATVAALSALTAPIHLIVGGSDKGLDMGALIEAIKARNVSVYLLAGTGTDRIKGDMPGTIYSDMAGAVTAAAQNAKSGDVVLLSPAFASFGMFKNEYDRGDQFNALVKGL